MSTPSPRASTSVPGHPADHEPHFLFLRQRRQEADNGEREEVIDVFYCARCLGRVETLAGVDLAEATPGRPASHRAPLPRLGSAVPGAVPLTDDVGRM